VNLEKSLRVGDRSDGHLVSVMWMPSGRRSRSKSWGASAASIALRGRAIAATSRARSIAVRRVSLTVNIVDGSHFEVNLIRTRGAITTFRNSPKSVGKPRNRHARGYVERIIAQHKQ
jgi:riboflavin synthase alpha subunit